MNDRDIDTQPDAAARREELIARARTLAPALRERAASAEAARCVPAETVADLHANGLTRICQPRRHGGFALGWDVLCEVGALLAAADGAQGWVQAIYSDHAQLLGTFPAEAQDEVWGENPRALMSASFEPNGAARRVDGGFRLSGRHGFASGIAHADWLICGGFIVDGEAREGPHFFLVRKSEAEVIEDWDAVGLEGTGSNSFVVDDVFVPAHRFLDGALARAGRGPGTDVNPEAVFRLPRGGLTPSIFAALGAGMAQGLLDDWLGYTARRLSRGVSVAAQPGAQFTAGQCSAEIAAAGALNLDTVRDAMRILGSGRAMDQGEIVRARRNAAYAANLALMAGTRLFNAAGGRAVFRGGALERQYRGLLAGVAHYSVAWDRNALEAGRALLDEAGA